MKNKEIYYIVNPHDLVIANFAVFGVGRDDELVFTRNGPLEEIISFFFLNDYNDVHPCSLASHPCESQVLSVVSRLIYFLKEINMTDCVQSDGNRTSIGIL